MSEQVLLGSLAKLRELNSLVPVRHWVSLKTQPVARVLRAAMDLGLGIEVVSEYELAAALGAGVPAGRILVNGICKHHWLPRRAVADLTVHFDSLAEVGALADFAGEMNWRVGLRCAMPEPDDGGSGDDASRWNQFGMTIGELASATEILGIARVGVSGLHFHLRTDVRQVCEYRRALSHVSHVSHELGLEPEYIDIGGGLPISGERLLDGTSTSSTFDFAEFNDWLTSIPSALPSIDEIWMENGRFLTGPAGALVITVLDKKERGDTTYLICDGGRVNHARMASLEVHELQVISGGNGRFRRTVVCGPTCSAVDRLGSWMLPESIQPGDHMVWLTAGAYHIPLETRFSTGLAPVVWFNARNEAEVIRKRETSAEWWGQWSAPEARQPALTY
jgi:diaminopimelate decarboxylase